jgi:UDP-glucose 4-epimerase
MTVLVTGGLGFIGSHAARALLDLGESCVLTRHHASSTPRFLAGEGIAVESLDCADAAAFLALGGRHEITGIVHLAATPTGVLDPIETLASNTQGVLNALRAAREWAVRRISIASTLGVYLGVDEHPFREDVALPIAPVDPIPVQKKVAELICALIAETEGLDVVSLRLSTVWGPLGPSPSPYFALPGMVGAAVRGVAPDLAPPAHADDGSDLIYVKDCARGIALLQLAENLSHRIYNVADGRATKNRQVAAAIAAALPGTAIDLPPGRDPNGPGRDTYLDITRIRRDTGYEPQWGIDRGMADYIAWLQAGNER